MDAVTLTGKGITFFFTRRLVTQFEIESRGMKMNRGPSALQTAKSMGLIPENCRSKKKGMEAAIEATKALLPSYEVSERTQKVLDGLK
jgi:hypothetical protein